MIVALFLTTSLAMATTAWTVPARNLTGLGHEATQKAAQELRAIPDLEKQLRAELKGEDKYLALDVIAALRLESLVPDIKAQARSDRSGFFYLTMNAFITPANQAEYLKFYLEKLNARGTPAAARVILLDTLGRAGTRVEPDDLRALLNDSGPEAGSAALYYLRGRLRAGDKDYRPLWTEMLKSKTVSLQRKAQMQALALELK